MAAVSVEIKEGSKPLPRGNITVASMSSSGLFEVRFTPENPHSASAPVAITISVRDGNGSFQQIAVRRPQVFVPLWRNFKLINSKTAQPIPDMLVTVEDSQNSWTQDIGRTDGGGLVQISNEHVERIKQCIMSNESTMPGLINVIASSPSFVDKMCARFCSPASLEHSHSTENIQCFPTIPPYQMTFTLQWNKKPSDLDSHCFTPDARHVFWKNKFEGENVNLDVDVQSGWGPETITVQNVHNMVKGR